MQFVCDYCGKEFERPRSVAMRPDRPQSHWYCSRECAQLDQKRMRKETQGVQEVGWLKAAHEDDELYLVNRILAVALAMRDLEPFSPEWEALSIRHSTLLDVARDIFRMRGKPAPENGEEKENEPSL